MKNPCAQQQEAVSEWESQGASWKVRAYSPAQQEFQQHAQIQSASLGNSLDGVNVLYIKWDYGCMTVFFRNRNNLMLYNRLCEHEDQPKVINNQNIGVKKNWMNGVDRHSWTPRVITAKWTSFSRRLLKLWKASLWLRRTTQCEEDILILAHSGLCGGAGEHPCIYSPEKLC